MNWAKTTTKQPGNFTGKNTVIGTFFCLFCTFLELIYGTTAKLAASGRTASAKQGVPDGVMGARLVSRAMIIGGNNRMSTVASCLAAAYHFQLSEANAPESIENQQHLIESNWSRVCDEAPLSETDRRLLWYRLFLNSYSILSGWFVNLGFQLLLR